MEWKRRWKSEVWHRFFSFALPTCYSFRKPTNFHRPSDTDFSICTRNKTRKHISSSWSHFSFKITVHLCELLCQFMNNQQQHVYELVFSSNTHLQYYWIQQLRTEHTYIITSFIFRFFPWLVGCWMAAIC